MKYLILLLLSLIKLQSIKLNSALKPRVTFILGAPLAGKGTQAQLLVESFGCIHLSAGDLLREERESGSNLSETIESYIKTGSIVPVSITLDLIRKAMSKYGASRYLIDGFPRNWDNYHGWMDSMQDAKVDSVLFLECSESELVERMHKRAALLGRTDDNPNTLAKRLTTFRDSTLPVVDNFRDRGILKCVNATSKSIDRVFLETSCIISDLIKDEILEKNDFIVNCFNNQNWDLYKNLCEDHVVFTGDDTNQHNSITDGWDIKSLSQNEKISYIEPPKISIHKKYASISYSFIRATNSGIHQRYFDFRVWNICGKENSSWKMVYLRRSKL